jgi:hypothetical protein
MFSDNLCVICRKISKVSLRKFAQLSSADAVYMTKRGTTYKRKVSAPPLGKDQVTQHHQQVEQSYSILSVDHTNAKT